MWSAEHVFAGLILVSEPYYNEAGYEKQKGTQQGHENSRMYNEMAILKMLQVRGALQGAAVLVTRGHCTQSAPGQYPKIGEFKKWKFSFFNRK